MALLSCTQHQFLFHQLVMTRMSYHSPEPDRFLRPQDALEGEAIVPGFSMSVAELFEEWDFYRRLVFKCCARERSKNSYQFKRLRYQFRYLR
jgi:hypothetical protein